MPPRKPSRAQASAATSAPDPRFAEQPSLFDEAAAAPPAQAAAAAHPAGAPSAATGLRVQAPGQRLRSPAGKAFERERERIERLRQQLQTLDAVGLAHRAQCAQRLAPLQQQETELRRRMVHALDAWFDGARKGLSPTQLALLRQIVIAQSHSLALAGDADMAALHDRRSPQTLAEQRRERAQAMHQELQQDFADALDTELPAFDPDNPDASLHATIDHLRQRLSEQDELKKAKRAQRQARRKPSAAQETAAAHLADADATLRLLYRQLASALHPDRASDAAEVAQKHALMSAVNAAYAQRDLVALLELQWRAELVDPEHLERVGEQRLKSLTLLLKQQAAALERDRQASQQRWCAEFGLPPYIAFSPTSLHDMLQDQLEDVQATIDTMQHDLQQVEALPSLKPWLNEQRRLMRAAEREQQRLADFMAWD
ncbi:hypothetical protein [Serpentinimonas barnesii]|uniref:hypothetical protein n=1 Tax=Serpentinimonas barnesii TaxID=1458427 RepID=UPI0004958E16|nr:hypothetical protein [Serpentinimonas barnesii]